MGVDTNCQANRGCFTLRPVERSIDAGRPVSSGNRPAFTNKREFKLTFTIAFVSGHNPGEWDLGLLDVATKAEMARIIQDYLEYVHQGWQITVKLESKPQFKPFD